MSNVLTKNIANATTCLNLLGGCMAIICAFRSEEPLWGLRGFEWAYIFIAIAAVADFMDGFSARMLHAYSQLGKELDSLCDLVSFGVAPAMLVFNIAGQEVDMDWVKWSALLIPVCGALRLARFNVEAADNEFFKGLPIPANAVFWIGFTSFMVEPGLVNGWIVLAAVVAVSYMMVSPVKLFTLKFSHAGWRGNQARWLLVVAAVVLLAFCGLSGLMWLVVYYIVWGICIGVPR